MVWKRPVSVLAALICGIVLIGAVSIWLSRIQWDSPRFDVLEPHIRFRATLADFQRVATEHHFSIEEEKECSWGLCRTIPLDGSMSGKQLKLHFYADGELQWAGIVGKSGDIEACLLAVDRK